MAGPTIKVGGKLTTEYRISTHERINSAVHRTSSSSIVLENGDAIVQSISMTAAGNNVSLPDATKFDFTGLKYVIHNDGENDFDVLDGGGAAVVTLGENQFYYAYLYDTSTVAGEWS